jgi:hypothetical protein
MYTSDMSCDCIPGSSPGWLGPELRSDRAIAGDRHVTDLLSSVQHSWWHE